MIKNCRPTSLPQFCCIGTSLSNTLEEFGFVPDYAIRHPKYRERRHARREEVWDRIFADVRFEVRAVTLGTFLDPAPAGTWAISASNHFIAYSDGFVADSGAMFSRKPAFWFRAIPSERVAPEVTDNGDTPMRIHAIINERTVSRSFREKRIGRNGLTVIDRDLPSFGLKVSKNGRKTFFVRAARPIGRSKTILGTADEMPAAEAREKAIAAIAAESVRVSARQRLIAIRPDEGFDVRIAQVTARGGIMR